MKKSLRMVLAAVLVLSIIAGCSSGNNGSGTGLGTNQNAGSQNNNDDQSSPSETVTLNFWAALDPSTDEGKAIQAQIDQFNNDHENIQVELEVITYDILHNKLVTSIIAGNPPDISWGLSEWFGEFNKLDALMDLTPYMDEWSDHHIYPNVLDALTVDGRVKALPNYLGIRALLYHDDILVEAGIDGPPRTWDELIAMAPIIKEATGKEAFGIAGAGVRSPQELIMYLAQNDVQLAEQMEDGLYKNTWQDNPDELERAAEVFAFYQELLDQGVIHSDARSWGWQEEDQNFVLAQYAMVVNGPWIEGRTSENPEGMADVKIAAPPYKLKPATFMEIAPLYLYADGNHPDETFEFAKFLVGYDYQSAINPTNSARSDVESESPWGKGFMDLADSGVVFPPVALAGITTAMEDALARAMIRGESPESVASWLSSAINQSLEQSGDLSSQ